MTAYSEALAALSSHIGWIHIHPRKENLWLGKLNQLRQRLMNKKPSANQYTLEIHFPEKNDCQVITSLSEEDTINWVNGFMENENFIQISSEIFLNTRYIYAIGAGLNPFDYPGMPSEDRQFIVDMHAKESISFVVRFKNPAADGTFRKKYFTAQDFPRTASGMLDFLREVTNFKMLNSSDKYPLLINPAHFYPRVIHVSGNDLRH